MIARIDFLKYRPISLIFSLTIFASFIGGVIYRYQDRGAVFSYSVDFTGGTQVLLGFSKPVSSEKVLEILEKGGMKGANAREFSEKEVLIRVKEYENDAKGLGEKIKATLEADLKDNTVLIKQTDSVGPGIGAELRYGALLAVLFALMIMLLYIWFRFRSIAYAMGSVMALIHDTIVILTFVIWFDYEISLNIIGAVLFILGYSINDTIVIFSRIRENILKRTGGSVEQVINYSLNAVLRRTILTSLSTLLVVIALLVFGGEVLMTLALALLIGMIFGTYSSIYVASPVMLLLYKEKK